MPADGNAPSTHPAAGTLASMVNDQWNDERPTEWQPPTDSDPQGTPSAAPQPSVNAWSQEEVQPAAGEWQQGQSANDWAQRAQWQEQPQPGMDGAQQELAGQQAWPPPQVQDPYQQQWQGGTAPGPMVPLPGQPQGSSPFSFDFSRFSLPRAAMTVWVVGAAWFALEWLFTLFFHLSWGASVVDYLDWLLVGLLGVVAKTLILRVVVELAVAAVRLVEQTKPKADDRAEESGAA